MFRQLLLSEATSPRGGNHRDQAASLEWGQEGNRLRMEDEWMSPGRPLPLSPVFLTTVVVGFSVRDTRMDLRHV